MTSKVKNLKKRIFDIIQIGSGKDFVSKFFDIFIAIVILVSLTATILSTFVEFKKYEAVLEVIELVSVIIFTIEYILRLWTANYLYPMKKGISSRLAFVFSASGLIDLITFFPYYLPIVFPAGAVAFRIFRVIRILRLFKINTRYDAFSVILDVLKEKRKQIFSSVVMVLILMVASSLCMYSLEHEAQPDKFKNAFSGIWWSTSTLLTIGYGDIYPVTVGGKIMAIIISFLGVGMVAIPTGIISAGFVETYTRINRIVFKEEEKPLHFVTSVMVADHPWNGKKVSEIIMPPETVLVIIIRDEEELIPNGDTVLQEDDVLIFAAKRFDENRGMNLSEITIKDEHEWIGAPLRKLDISRQALVVMIKRRGKIIIPKGDTIIKAGDELVMYTNKYQKE
ncbi:voltage-gated potassium channel [Lachnospiraceae bacterium YSD2013]|nr:voltage-gated potassium channel [Lachnospiraceae bacterium YSD2013]